MRLGVFGPTRAGYRPEIDGLRAISVLGVVFFHASIPGSSGGFVGVDVFFVISGFLITRILIEENRNGDFSFLRFYERRVRRILPALYVVLAASFAAALYLMLPNTLIDFTRSLMATLLFGSNIYFWQGTDYFAPDAGLEPLLHTWSLGVEEQYYLLFPLILMLLWRFRVARPIIFIAVGTLASLVLSEVLWRTAPAANFYLLPTRAWQLGLGSLGAFLSFRQGGMPLPVRRWVAEALAGAGLFLVVGSIVLMDAETPTPSIEGAAPTFGALLVLLFAIRGTLAARLLSLPPMVGIGLVSYSAYLWHQPLFAFARLAYPDSGLGPVLSLSLIARTFLLAWATLILVERPFHNRDFLTRSQLFLGSAAGTVVLLACGGIIPQTGGLRGLYPVQLRELASMSLPEQAAYVGSACREEEKPTEFAADRRPRLMLIGDSYSEDFCNMIRENGAFAGYQIIVRHIQAKCQIYLGPEDTMPLIAPEDRYMCALDTKASDLVGLTREADVIVFAARWRPWAIERMPTTMQNFHFRPDQTVIVIGRKGFSRINRPRVAGASAEELVAMRSKPGRDELGLATTMRAAFPPGTLVDPYALVCPNQSCPLFTPEGRLISWDGAHLTRAGAAYVGAKLFSEPPLARFAAPARVGE